MGNFRARFLQFKKIPDENGKKNADTVQKPISLTFVQIPFHYNAELPIGKLPENIKCDKFDKNVFQTMTREGVIFLLDVYNILQDISDNEVKYQYQDGIKLDFHNKLTIKSSDLPFINDKQFNISHVELIKFLFNDLRNTRNIILITNSLVLFNISDKFKNAIYDYFKEIWSFELSKIDDDFIRDVLSICLKIWEMKIISQIVSDGK
ncbi:unnamed protein product [Candida verbasci]|uniref:Uncharacterized protein n=1 Tax=Candida verbasci TaxID=1227364 RepID=A0A9W4XCI8_9ASCO|nr:unnamed protein product [Candida verbasci]